MILGGGVGGGGDEPRGEVQMVQDNQLVHFWGITVWRERQDHNPNVDAVSMVSQPGFVVPEAGVSAVGVHKPLPDEVILSHTIDTALHELFEKMRRSQRCPLSILGYYLAKVVAGSQPLRMNSSGGLLRAPLVGA